MSSLTRLTKEEWSLLSGRLTYEDWAIALVDSPAEVADALLASLPEGARKVLAQMITSKPGDAAARRAAQDKVAKAAAALAAEGRIPDLSSAPELALNVDTPPEAEAPATDLPLPEPDSGLGPTAPEGESLLRAPDEPGGPGLSGPGQGLLG
jgi:hypothetical protein